MGLTPLARSKEGEGKKGGGGGGGEEREPMQFKSEAEQEEWEEEQKVCTIIQLRKYLLVKYSRCLPEKFIIFLF